MSIIDIGALVCAGAAAVALAGAVPAHAKPLQTCTSGQVEVSNGGEQGGAGHRRVALTFHLTPDSQPCVLTGYPMVETGAGGPRLQASETLSGYMGGVTGMDGRLPLVPLSPNRDAVAIVEGLGTDRSGGGCPQYTELRVTPPGSTDPSVVPVRIDVCDLQVHPVTSTAKMGA